MWDKVFEDEGEYTNHMNEEKFKGLKLIQLPIKTTKYSKNVKRALCDCSYFS